MVCNKAKRRKFSADLSRTMALLPADDKEFTLETREASPAHLLVEIESFSMLSKHGIGKYESREFVAGDYKWKFIIYPNGFDEKDDDAISVYLCMVKPSSLPADWEVNAMLTAFLYNHDLDNYLCFRGKVERFHEINYGCGFSKLISKKIFTEPSNGYLVDDKCVFGAEVFVIRSQRVIERVSVLKATDPYKRDWKISDFSKLEGVWTSEEFPAGGHRWKVKLYPDGNGSGKGRSVSIYLECVDSKNFAPHQKVKVDFCLGIKNKSYYSHRHSKSSSDWFTSSVPDWGFAEFIRIEDMRDSRRGFVVDDCCFLETEISVQVSCMSNMV